MPSFASESKAASRTAIQQRSRGWHAALRKRAPVTTAVSAIFLGGFVAVLLIPGLIPFGALVPAALTRPWNWYRFLTYTLIHASLLHWLMVAGVALASGWLAERWLEARTMWIIGCIAALASGIIYALLAPPQQPAIGGGFVAAGFAGAAVVSSLLRRRAVSRGGQMVALALLLMYGLAPLRTDPQSLAMLGAFLAAGGYAGWRLRSSATVSSG